MQKVIWIEQIKKHYKNVLSVDILEATRKQLSKIAYFEVKARINLKTKSRLVDLIFYEHNNIML